MHAYNERHHSSDGAHGRRTKPRQENRDRTCPQGRPSPRTTYLVSDVLASSERAWRFQDDRTRAQKKSFRLILSEYLYSFARRQRSRSRVHAADVSRSDRCVINCSLNLLLIGWSWHSEQRRCPAVPMRD